AVAGADIDLGLVEKFHNSNFLIELSCSVFLLSLAQLRRALWPRAQPLIAGGGRHLPPDIVCKSQNAAGPYCEMAFLSRAARRVASLREVLKLAARAAVWHTTPDPALAELP